MYINKILPFLKDSDFVGSSVDTLQVSSIYCPVNFNQEPYSSEEYVKQPRDFKVFYVLPLEIYVLDEDYSSIRDIVSRKYGESIRVKTIRVDYMSIAKRVQIDSGVARIQMGSAFNVEDEVVSSAFVNAAANGVPMSFELLEDFIIEPSEKIDLSSFVEDDMAITEALDRSILARRKNAQKANANKRTDVRVVDDGEDTIYSILDSYFALPEGEDIKNGGREVVPLLIGPTGVFKSATVKELCKKYNYRLVDFRVSFTSRLDYSGLFNMQELDGEMYSYACPMEELVTCSDGFREYCRKAHDKLDTVLSNGYIEVNKSSNGQVSEGEKQYLTPEQIEKIKEIQAQYREYMKTPVLFFDEITRTTDGGVEGILVELLNQKRFNNMTLNGCKFVAATNLNLKTGNIRHDNMMESLDDMYQVNNELDVAYSNRFLPLKVLPKDVEGRWYSWAEGDKVRNGKQIKNIHPIVMEFLKSPAAIQNGESLVYNETPILDAIDNGLSDEEKKAQTFPNYRTWEMASDYMYSIDDDYEERLAEANAKGVVKNQSVKKLYRETILNGLISEWACKYFIPFLKSKGYESYNREMGDPTDDVGDFLSSTLSSGVPALLIGPSSLGKTSRVKAYMKGVEKKTGLKPVLIDVNLASMDTVDIMGMPTKRPLVKYVAGDGLQKLGLGALAKELGNTIKEVRDANPEMGLVDTLTLRAPDMTKKELFKKAINEGREVILFFDECNRCLTADTKIRLLDGRILSMKEIYDEYGTDKEFWVYGCDSNGNFVPGRAKSLGITRKDAELVEITLDNGATIRCTPDHPIMLRDGRYVHAEDLVSGDSLKAAYFRYKKEGAGRRELISVSGSEYHYTHRLVGNYNYPNYLDEGLVAHHNDRDTLNNEPSNIHVISKADHLRVHEEKQYWKYNPTEEQLASMRACRYNNLMNNMDKREAHRIATITDKVKGAKFRESNKARWTEDLRVAQSCNCCNQWASGQFDSIDRVNAMKLNNSTALVRFICELFELGFDVTPDNYEELRISNTGRGKVRYKATKVSRVSECTRFNDIAEAIEEALAYCRGPVNHRVVKVKHLSYVEDVYDINVDDCHNFLVDLGDNSGVWVHNCKNPVIMSAMFEAISDYRIFGISFKEQKDKVKIVAACNMAHSELGANLEWGEVGDYNNAGSIDPALAARFSIYWKKNYDEKDVKSFVSFLHSEVDDGNVDGLILEYFEGLSPNDAIKVMASVEKRKLENAESSTRALFQLSKDIRSMRGQKGANGFKKSLFNGRVLFNKVFLDQFVTLKTQVADKSLNIVDVANYAVTVADKFLSNSSSWEPLLVNSSVVINGEEMVAQDVVDTIEALRDELKDYLARPITNNEKAEIKVDVDTLYTFLGACSRLDMRVIDKRKDIFNSYVGESFTEGFLPFFNDNFGTVNDVVITIEMLDDDSLIEPFVNRFYSKIVTKTSDDQVTEMLGLIKEFADTFHSTLPAKNYADLLTCIKGVLNSDSMPQLINLCSKDQDEVFANAEGVGDRWIFDILRNYPASFTQDDIDEMRDLISNSKATSTRVKKSNKRRSRIL